jgi:large subunit ribosomal protein L12
MEYVYAALLLHKAGKPVDEDSIIGVLKAAGVNADPVRAKALVASLSEVNIDEALKSQPMVMPAAAPTAPTPKAEEKPAEEKKKKEEKEKEAEKAIEGLGALFG